MFPASFLDIMAATGQRQRPGSMTSFNTEMKSNVGGVSGAIAGAGKHVVGAGFKWPAAVSRKFEQWSLGRNLDQLADLMVNPEAATRFRQLANAPIGSGKALAIATRLAVLAGHRARRSDQLTDSSK
jgi:hypothetical protein